MRRISSYIKTSVIILLASFCALFSYVYVEPYLANASLVVPDKTLSTLRKKIESGEISYLVQITVIVTPSPKPIPPTPIPSSPETPAHEEGEERGEQEDIEWGVAKKIDDHTYTITVGEDETMASPQEIVDALNRFRSTHGVGSLTPDGSLTSYAQQRADLFSQIGSTDGHAGFNNFLENEDGFKKLGFNRVGENSYYGVSLEAAHVIEWIFSASPEHNANQLDGGWTHVGVGTNSKAVNLVFGAH